MKIVLALAAIAILALAYFWVRQRSKQPAPFESIVLLLREPANVDRRSLAAVFSEETGKDVTPTASNEDGGSGNFVMGDRPRFVAAIDRVMFLINARAEAYVKASDPAVHAIKDENIRAAVDQHHAWISIDFLEREQANDENYRLIARVLSHFADANCVALYHPASNTLVPSTQSTQAVLRTEDPRMAIFNLPGISWLGNGQGEDPRLKAAEAEARRRFPEFEQAFHQKRGAFFLIKTRFASGDHVEHMWSQVNRILPDKIDATLGENPSNSVLPKAGTEISVGREEIEDWGIQNSNGDLIMGAFSDAVLKQLDAERKQK